MVFVALKFQLSWNYAMKNTWKFFNLLKTKCWMLKQFSQCLEKFYTYFNEPSCTCLPVMRSVVQTILYLSSLLFCFGNYYLIFDFPSFNRKLEHLKPKSFPLKKLVICVNSYKKTLIFPFVPQLASSSSNQLFVY